ncbi:MAG: Gfo/Idh/MocA family oxidoreductase [Spirochaetes bacterium]|nr:Gfo/Idh/MocA family oxidoreductase [Spirochaetota bacterium]
MLNFGVIGCGKIALRHCGLLSDGLIKDGLLKAVCDKNRDRAETFGKKFKVPYYTDIDKMLENENLDVVTVLTPSGLHTEIVIKAAEYKKHIIVEKPLALTLEDADKMIYACDLNQVRLFVVNQNRFNVPIVKLKEAIDKNRFGKMVLGTVRVRWMRTDEYYKQDKWRGTWAYDGGVLTNQASHHIDLLEWLMGDIKSVFAKSITALADIEVEDTACAVLKFRNGALGLIEATTAVRPKDIEGAISILGEKGSVEIGGFSANKIKLWQFSDYSPEDKEIISKFNENPPDTYGYGHKIYLNHAVDCIINKRKALVDGLEGRKSLELISALYESIETGKEIFLKFEPDKCKLGHK